MLRLYRFYRSGVLPFPGGLFAQPAFYMDAMNFIDRYIASMNEDEQ